MDASPFHLASDQGLGPVLPQIQEGKERVIGYASRALRKSERNYSTIEKEALGIVWAVAHFRQYLYGQRFILITDHQPLTWLKSFKEPKGRIARWILQLEEYDWEVRHRPGKLHANADALSRYQPQERLEEVVWEGDESCLWPPFEQEAERNIGPMVERPVRVVGFSMASEEVRELQMKDPLLSLVLRDFPRQAKVTGPWARNPRWLAIKKVWHQLVLEEGVLYRVRPTVASGDESQRQLLVVPNAHVAEVLHQCHDMDGHLAYEKTLEKISERFWWPMYTTQVGEYVRSCERCQKRNPVKKSFVPMQSVPVGGPFEMIGMDFVGPLPLSDKGNRYLLVVSDYYTTWAEAMPDQKAETTAQALISRVVFRYGMPLVIHSDQGRNLESAVIREMCEMLGIKISRTTPYHPQGDGLVERLNTTLIQSLSKYVRPNQTDWDRWVQLVEFGYNTSRHRSTGQTPFELCCGRKARLPVEATMSAVLSRLLQLSMLNS